MRRASCRSVSALLLASLVGAFGLVPSPAAAQIYETIGIRAQGMGGAFVALADDATATWWNPAGLAVGPYFNLTAEASGRFERDRPVAGLRGVSAATPALALSYYRLPVSGIPTAGAKESTSPDRQDQRILSEFGVTFGQSVGDQVILGSTLKLDRAAGDVRGDLDIGALLRVGRARLAVVMKNVTEPTFGSGTDAVALRRELRAGAALFAMPVVGATLAMTVDADLTTVGTRDGDERHVAAGAEMSTFGARLAVRGGAALNTTGDARPSGSAGMSAALRRGVYLDGQVTAGRDDARKGWSLGARVTF